MAIIIRSKWARTSTTFSTRRLHASKKALPASTGPEAAPAQNGPTTFLTLPHELRQKILMDVFETYKLHYLLHSPTREADYLTAHIKYLLKMGKIITRLHEMVGVLKLVSELSGDVVFVSNFWKREMDWLVGEWRRLEGRPEREERDGYDSDESDEEDGREYFDCLEE